MCSERSNVSSAKPVAGIDGRQTEKRLRDTAHQSVIAGRISLGRRHLDTLPGEPSVSSILMKLVLRETSAEMRNNAEGRRRLRYLRCRILDAFEVGTEFDLEAACEAGMAAIDGLLPLPRPHLQKKESATADAYPRASDVEDV